MKKMSKETSREMNLSQVAKNFLEMMLNTYGEVAGEPPLKVGELDKLIVQDIVMDGFRMHEIFPEEVDLEVIREVIEVYGLVGERSLAHI